jgi:ribosome biogenesis GTPase
MVQVSNAWKREYSMTLEEFGFNSWFRDQVDPDHPGDLTIARVTAVHKGACEVSDGEESRDAKTTGRLRHQAKSKLDYPTVGDWVLVKDFNHEDFGTIQTVLKRQSELKRKTAGRTVCYQLIAANIDTVFIMQSLDSGYNLQRLERYLVMANESGIEPVVLLSKRDLLSEKQLEQIISEVLERVPNVQVLAFSNTDRTGLEEAMALFHPGNTYCIVGSSGVGKTTILNNLLGEEDYLFTLPVREKDGKGVHSTTWRELITLENGAMVIDTPGMRELGNINVTEGINETFDEIFALSSECRFNDCSHIKTPGCAVIQAVEDGTIDRSRYNNFIRLMKEVAVQEQSAIDKRNKDKAASRFHQSIQSRNRKNQ